MSSLNAKMRNLKKRKRNGIPAEQLRCRPQSNSILKPLSLRILVHSRPCDVALAGFQYIISVTAAFQGAESMMSTTDTAFDV
mmetsp:Transcript_11565/g.17601  ORF Transcript_11565/g.17601 Transcript_11565/m.17601 type:complete len:82 (+) Transcript_11565:235-480(+)